MEKYGDEGFISLLRRKNELARNKNIREGIVWDGDEALEFQEREIVKRQVWMWLPKVFGYLSKEHAKLKYPNENRPDIIYTSPDTTINISFFTNRKEALPAGAEQGFRDNMEQIFYVMHPSCSTIEKKTVQSEMSLIAWFDTITPAMDSEIYNLMYFTSFKERLFMGSCNCLRADMDVWKDFFIQMLASLRMA